MLSKEIQQKLDELYALMDQRIAIDEKIEALFSDGTSVQEPTKQWHKRKPKSEAPAEPTPQRKRRNRVTPNFTNAEIEKMVRESDDGKKAQAIVKEYGFSSIAAWYTLKSNYKKRHSQSTAADVTPDHADDEEEPEDEAVLVDNPLHISNTTHGAPKRYRYECNCGYSFKSTVPPKLIKCPDCMGKPRLVEEVKEEN